MLDRHEGRADLHDDPLDVGEELVAAVLAGDDDPDVVLRLCLEPVPAKEREELVAIRNASRFHLNRAYRIQYLAFGRRPTRSEPILDPSVAAAAVEVNRYFPDSMAVATENEDGLVIGGEAVEPASGGLRELRAPATGSPKPIDPFRL